LGPGEKAKNTMDSQEGNIMSIAMTVLILLVLICALGVIGILLEIHASERRAAKIRRYIKAVRTLKNLGDLVNVLPEDEREAIKQDAKIKGD
jgi:Na+/proline symporter